MKLWGYLLCLSLPFTNALSISVMGSLGDSITRGFNADGTLDSPELSWSTGNNPSKKVDSHYHRLKALGHPVTQFHNVAKNGAKAAGLLEQIRELIEKKPEYVTLLIGANDVCGWDNDYESSLEHFRDDVREAIENLITNLPEVRILLAPIPDMYQLYQAGMDKGCSVKWNIFRICQKLLGRNRTEEQRLEFRKRVDNANRELEFISYDFKDNIRYVKEGERYPFTKEHVSGTDCFHPSLKGQNLLSEISWANGFF